MDDVQAHGNKCKGGKWQMLQGGVGLLSNSFHPPIRDAIGAEFQKETQRLRQATPRTP